MPSEGTYNDGSYIDGDGLGYRLGFGFYSQ